MAGTIRSKTSSVKSDNVRQSRSGSGPRAGCSKTKSAASSRSSTTTTSRTSRKQGSTKGRGAGANSHSGNSGDEIGNGSQGSRRSMKRDCSFKGNYQDKITGQKMIRERFLKDAKEEQARKKKALQDTRSNGVRNKCNQLVTLSQKSGFKVSATFLPTWDRGVPHSVLSENWEEDDKPLKPIGALKRTYVKNWDNVEQFSVEEAGESSSSGDTRRGVRIRSPNQIRPLAKPKPNGKSVPQIKCTACNATYYENSSKLWMFCGASLKRGKCVKLAVHAECHFMVADSQKELDKVCKLHIRCLDCRLREREEKKKLAAEKKKEKEKRDKKDKEKKEKAKNRGSWSDSQDFVS